MSLPPRTSCSTYTSLRHFLLKTAPKHGACSSVAECSLRSNRRDTLKRCLQGGRRAGPHDDILAELWSNLASDWEKSSVRIRPGPSYLFLFVCLSALAAVAALTVRFSYRYLTRPSLSPAKPELQDSAKASRPDILVYPQGDLKSLYGKVPIIRPSQCYTLQHSVFGPVAQW